MTDELCQLYNEQGNPIAGKGGIKNDIFSKGLLHAAAHVWIWRKNASGDIQILLQKRAAKKRTWPGRFDISAAGHIDLGEEPLTAAIRETEEEIGYSVAKEDLLFCSVFRAHLVTPTGDFENELQWIYTLQVPASTALTLQRAELESISWVSFEELKKLCNTDAFVPHGQIYFDTVIEALERASNATV